MVTGECSDVSVVKTGSTWQQGIGQVFGMVPGFREAAGAGRAVQFAAISISILALVGIGYLLVKARK